MEYNRAISSAANTLKSMQICSDLFTELSSSFYNDIAEMFLAESCLLSSEKKEWNIAWRLRDSGADTIYGYVVPLKCSNAMPSIDTYRFTQ